MNRPPSFKCYAPGLLTPQGEAAYGTHVECTKVYDKDDNLVAEYINDDWWIAGNGVVNMHGCSAFLIADIPRPHSTNLSDWEIDDEIEPDEEGVAQKYIKLSK